jgi:hypothetical protein
MDPRTARIITDAFRKEELVVAAAAVTTHLPVVRVEPALHSVHVPTAVGHFRQLVLSVHASQRLVVVLRTPASPHLVHKVALEHNVQLVAHAVQAVVPQKPSLQAEQVAAEEHALQFCV